MRPNVREFEDYRKFIGAYLTWMASEDRRFSMRWVAQRAGFTSPSMLSMVVNGKRALPRNRIANLLTAMKLLPDEEEHFRLIYEVAQCEDAGELGRLQKQLSRDAHFADITLDGYEIFEHWYLPAIREMTTLKDFRTDPFWIARKLGITPMEARDGLSTLFRIGMLTQNGKKIERSLPSLKPMFEITNVQAKMESYNAQLAELSASAVRWPKPSRYFDSLTVAISQKSMARIPEIIKRVIAEIDQIAETDAVRDDVVQINIQMLGLTTAENRRCKPVSTSKTQETDRGGA